MITFIVHLRVKHECAAEFEALLAYVCTKVREHEPDVAYYAFARSTEDPDTYVVVEVYRDPEARSAHMLTKWVQESLSKVAFLIDGKPDIRQYVSSGSAPIPSQAGS
jgi:quinol monooxygenase YgiN